MCYIKNVEYTLVKPGGSDVTSPREPKNNGVYVRVV